MDTQIPREPGHEYIGRENSSVPGGTQKGHLAPKES